jgi:hypothetical protein
MQDIPDVDGNQKIQPLPPRSKEPVAEGTDMPDPGKDMDPRNFFQNTDGVRWYRDPHTGATMYEGIHDWVVTNPGTKWNPPAASVRDFVGHVDPIINGEDITGTRDKPRTIYPSGMWTDPNSGINFYRDPDTSATWIETSHGWQQTFRGYDHTHQASAADFYTQGHDQTQRHPDMGPSPPVSSNPSTQPQQISHDGNVVQTSGIAAPPSSRTPVLVYSASTPAILNNGVSSTDVYYFTNTSSDYLNTARNNLSVNDMIMNAPDQYRDLWRKDLTQAEQIYEATGSLRSLSLQVWSPSNMVVGNDYYMSFQTRDQRPSSGWHGTESNKLEYTRDAPETVTPEVDPNEKYDVVGITESAWASYGLYNRSTDLFNRSLKQMETNQLNTGETAMETEGETDAFMGDALAETGETDMLLGETGADVLMGGGEAALEVGVEAAGAELSMDALLAAGIVAAPELVAVGAAAGIAAGAAGLVIGGYELYRALGGKADSPALDHAADWTKTAVEWFAKVI